MLIDKTGSDIQNHILQINCIVNDIIVNIHPYYLMDDIETRNQKKPMCTNQKYVGMLLMYKRRKS